MHTFLSSFFGIEDRILFRLATSSKIAIQILKVCDFLHVHAAHPGGRVGVLSIVWETKT